MLDYLDTHNVCAGLKVTNFKSLTPYCRIILSTGSNFMDGVSGNIPQWCGYDNATPGIVLNIGIGLGYIIFGFIIGSAAASSPVLILAGGHVISFVSGQLIADHNDAILCMLT